MLRGRRRRRAQRQECGESDGVRQAPRSARSQVSSLRPPIIFVAAASNLDGSQSSRRRIVRPTYTSPASLRSEPDRNPGMKPFSRFDTRRRLFVLLPILFLVNTVLLIGALYNFSGHDTVIDFLHSHNGPRTLLCHNVMNSPETIARLETLGVSAHRPPIRESAPLSAPRAKVISPSELMSRYTASLVPTGVSKIIHQSWKSRTPPDLLQYFVDSWRVVYPEYEYGA